MGKVLTFATYMSLCLAMWACNTNGCLENRNSVPLAGFYGSGTDSYISLDSLQIEGVGAPGDSVLSTPGSAINQIYLPMRSTQTGTKWKIAYKWKALDYPELCDTIDLTYRSEPYFASEECGAIYRYHITRVSHTEHLIDSVAITDSTITNVDIERIRIYFRTNPGSGDENQE